MGAVAMIFVAVIIVGLCSGGSKGGNNTKRNTNLTKADYGRMGAKLGRSMARSMCRMKW